MSVRGALLMQNPKFSAVPWTEKNEIMLASKQSLEKTRYEKKSNLLFEKRTEQRYFVSVGYANSNDRELNLNSNNADNSNSFGRLRLALVLRAFCFQPLSNIFANGNYYFKMIRIPAVGNEFFVHGNFQ